MQQESGGHEYLNGGPITSSAGAMGLMQLMPQTYAEMQNRLGLGADPYEPHDNIAAGSEYIGILSRKYGSPAFLAAYNAGPHRLEDYLNRGRPLPNETVAYVAAISPHLGSSAQPEPTATPQTRTTGAEPEAQTVHDAWAQRHYDPVPDASLSAPVASGDCDPNAAYDSSNACPAMPQPLSPPAETSAEMPATSVPEAQSTPLPPLSSSLPEQDAPPDPSSEGPSAVFPATPRPERAFPRTALPEAPAHYGSWSIQVGAFANVGQARFAATMARQAAFSILQATQIVVQPVGTGHITLWRGRLSGLDHRSALQACHQLARQGMACIPESPGH